MGVGRGGERDGVRESPEQRRAERKTVGRRDGKVRAKERRGTETGRGADVPPQTDRASQSPGASGYPDGPVREERVCSWNSDLGRLPPVPDVRRDPGSPCSLWTLGPADTVTGVERWLLPEREQHPQCRETPAGSGRREQGARQMEERGWETVDGGSKETQKERKHHPPGFYLPCLAHFLLDCRLQESRHFSRLGHCSYSNIQNTGLDSQSHRCPSLAV